MQIDALTNLVRYFPRYAELQETYGRMLDLRTGGSEEDVIHYYSRCLDQLEPNIWQEAFEAQRFKAYQAAFRELEQAIARSGNDRRHGFVVVIPVADRPQQLHACLQSLLTLCETFEYGGRDRSGYSAVRVLIADDSREAVNIKQHQDSAKTFTQRGLVCEYFGAEAQLACLQRVNIRDRNTSIFGDADADAFYHKGASVTRNIACLRLAEISGEENRVLFYFIDSDQTFQQPLNIEGKEQRVYGINYLYQLDRLFASGGIHMLTGKVVGDPPVSPAVMAGKFMQDVQYFLQEIADLAPHADCAFHHVNTTDNDDASYHDMAELFGFGEKSEAFRFVCARSGEHDNQGAFREFARRLSHFFDGEHPTRKSWYRYVSPRQLLPARTVYTGNYVFDVRGLDYFIPFAHRRLRMAGPVLGRIVKSELGEGFVSSALPMLHGRTLADTGKAEFRHGIRHHEQHIDLSGEYERQFYGDVMLFSMEALVAEGYPQLGLTRDHVSAVVAETCGEMLSRYQTRSEQIQSQLQQLQAYFSRSDHWWHEPEELRQARDEFMDFFNNVRHNYGATAAGMRGIREHSARRCDELVDSILAYPSDREHWRQALLQVKQA